MSEVTNNATNQPTHILYNVTGEDEKAHWTKIGAAWTHKDKKGLNLSIELMPTQPGRFVIRKYEPKDKSEL